MGKIMELISYESDNKELIGKISIDDLKTKSAIIVNESQEALFYKDGQALDLFLSGRHEITTDSIPLFFKLFQRWFGTTSPLPCSVYFINKVNVLDMSWGTPGPIPMMDPKYNLLINVIANGSMGVRISDSRKFVVKIVGQVPSISADDVKRYIKGVMMANIKNSIADIIQGGVSILEIHSHLYELSEKMQKKINEKTIPEWGIELVNFYFNSITAQDSDLEALRLTSEKRMKGMADIELERARKLSDTDIEVQKKNALGDAAWEKLMNNDLMKTFAENQGNGNGMASMGAGIGMGMAMASNLSNMMSSSTPPMGSPAPTPAPAPEAPQDDPIKALGKLKQLLDAGLITEEDYAQKKKEILSRL